MSAPTVTRSESGRLSLAWDDDSVSTEVAREVLEEMVANHNAQLDEIDRLRAKCAMWERLTAGCSSSSSSAWLGGGGS